MISDLKAHESPESRVERLKFAAAPRGLKYKVTTRGWRTGCLNSRAHLFKHEHTVGERKYMNELTYGTFKIARAPPTPPPRATSRWLAELRARLSWNLSMM